MRRERPEKRVEMKYKYWQPLHKGPSPQTFLELAELVYANRRFSPMDRLEYGDYGLEGALETLTQAIQQKKKIALYADYDVDGTMSCVSWVWFLQAMGYPNFTYYIPDRFSEGYGVNLEAVKYLALERGAQVIITMDTGITANEEAKWCRENGIEFICTDHHKIQPNKMPDCVILNPKLHPDPQYQELCGCGITFVLLRKLATRFSLSAPDLWTDLLALAGMATICDVVPLNGVNHRLAQQGIAALLRSKRPILRKLLEAASVHQTHMDERDVGFRLGPRINAVGRLEHAKQVVEAFLEDQPDALIHHMGLCNERRKKIQTNIVKEAHAQAHSYAADPILFLGGSWHQGVVGIAASKIAEIFWKPVWLFDRQAAICKGSARSIPGFDVTDAMASVAHLFKKFGGHRAAGGFTFDVEQETALREALNHHARQQKEANPQMWDSVQTYDCELPLSFLTLDLMTCLSEMRPFGHGFEEPRFMLTCEITRTQFYKDRETGEPKHTAVELKQKGLKIMFFNEVHPELEGAARAKFLVTASKNLWQGQVSLSLIGSDFSLC